MTPIDEEIVRAYIKLVRYGRPVSVRGFQRLMGYKSPGKAQRVLERLVREGLAIRRDDGDYEPIRNASTQLDLLVIRRIIIPRRAAISGFITSLSIIYAFIANIDLATRFILIAIGVAGLIDLYSVIKTYKNVLK